MAMKPRKMAKNKTTKMARGGTGGKPVAMKRGGKMKMVEKGGKKVPAFAADGVGKMKRGGKPSKMMRGGKTKK